MATIFQWDCIEILKSIPDKSIDLLCTDPPYEFINKNPKWWWFMTKENKQYVYNFAKSCWMSFDPTEFLNTVKNKMVLFNAYIFTNKNLIQQYLQFAEENWYKRDILIWLKPNPVPNFNWHYLIDKEYCIYIKEKWATFNTDLWYTNYFTYESHPIGSKKKYNHPTIKPLEMIERIIQISSKEWDTVLDCYLWSWTTAVACKKLNRNCIGIEKNEEYVEMAKRRLEEIDEIKEQRLFSV